MSERRTLWYVTDPMCAWCWGFAPVLKELEPLLADDVELRYVLGGLAPDSDEPMDPATRDYVQRAWHAVAAHAGVEFEHAFWERCQPRRSTWPACRAVVAARRFDREREVFGGIQRAYYQRARNPSDEATLVAVAVDAGLDEAAFRAELDAPRTHEAFAADLERKDALGASGFPTLATDAGLLTRGYVDLPTALVTLRAAGLVRRES